MATIAASYPDGIQGLNDTLLMKFADVTGTDTTETIDTLGYRTAFYTVVLTAGSTATIVVKGSLDGGTSFEQFGGAGGVDASISIAPAISVPGYSMLLPRTLRIDMTGGDGTLDLYVELRRY